MRRRSWIATVGALALAGGLARVGAALAAGRVEKGVHRVRGEANINGKPAVPGMDVRAGDVIITGRGGELVFVVGHDAMLVRADSRVEIGGKAGALIATGLRIVTGAVLSVFTPGQKKTVQTRTATIGIRGTGLYVEIHPQRDYVCTCYGVADIVPIDDPSSRETVETRHHDQPRYVMAKGAPQMIMRAPIVNHSDVELILLEDLVGREPPFTSEPGYEPGAYNY